MEGGAQHKSDGIRESAPRITGFFDRGRNVSVSARTGNDLRGYVCDVDENGLLLDVRDASGDATGYAYLPWSSIERVNTQG